MQNVHMHVILYQKQTKQTKQKDKTSFMYMKI